MIYGLSAALFGEITVKNGRVEQGNFDTYPVVRLKDAPKTEVYLALTGGKKWGGVGEPGATMIPAGGDQRHLRRHRQAAPLAADQRTEIVGSSLIRMRVSSRSGRAPIQTSDALLFAGEGKLRLLPSASQS